MTINVCPYLDMMGKLRDYENKTNENTKTMFRKPRLYETQRMFKLSVQKKMSPQIPWQI